MFTIPNESASFDDAWFACTPLFRRIESQINLPLGSARFRDTGLQYHVAVRWAGILRVPVTGVYTLSELSDDGARVSLDGRRVAGVGEAHAARTEIEEIPLTAGDHELVVDYRNFGGEMACVLSWKPPGGKEEVVPALAFFHARRHIQTHGTVEPGIQPPVAVEKDDGETDESGFLRRAIG